MWRNEYGKIGKVYFHFFKAINDAFEALFSRASFLHYITDTGSIWAMQLRFKVETLLNNAFQV